MSASRLFRFANLSMGLLFIYCVAVQYNDPDPVRWMTIYGLAAIASFTAGRGPTARALAAVTAAAALVWAALLAPTVLRAGQFREMFGPRGMMEPGVEEARELLGLLIVVAWMAVVVLCTRSADRR